MQRRECLFCSRTTYEFDVCDACTNYICGELDEAPHEHRSDIPYTVTGMMLLGGGLLAAVFVKEYLS